MKRPAGRRAGKVARAGLPKAKRSRALQPPPPVPRPLSAEAERDSRTLNKGVGMAEHAPAKWSAAEKRARREARAAAAAAAAAAGGEEEAGEAEEEPAEERQPAGRSQHGSHFVTGNVESGRVNDEWQTTADAWAELEPLLSHWKKRRVWMPFWYDGKCAEHMKELGFKHVVHEEADFFARARDQSFLAGVDIIIDNPPYTSAETKEAVICALVDTAKPFCILLPSSVLFTQLFRNNLPDGVQLVLPRRVKVCKTGGDPVPFKQMVWICRGCELAKDLNFVGV